MMGRVVKILVNDQQTTYYKSTQYNPTNDYGKPVSAGVYLYKIQADLYIFQNFLKSKLKQEPHPLAGFLVCGMMGRFGYD